MRHEVPEPWASAMIKEGITDPRNGTRPSWREMSRRTGVHTTTLIAMASGDRVTRPGVVEAVATALKMSPRIVSEWVGVERSEWHPYAPPDEANLLDRNERDAVDTVIKLFARSKRGEREPNGHEPDSNETVPEQTGAASATNSTRADNGDGSQLGVRGRTARLRRGRGPDSRGSEQADATAERTPGQPAPPVV